MLRHERRLLIDSLLIGAALTLMVVAFDGAGFLTPAEDFLYDVRARTCQFFTPPPTDKLVHLDIDDPAIDAVGRWPWGRGTWAQIFDEIRLAAPKAVEMDVLFSEPQKVEYVPKVAGDIAAVTGDPSPATTTTTPAASTTTTQPATDAVAPAPAAPTTAAVAYDRVDDDSAFTDAIRRLGNVILSVNFEVVPRTSRTYDAMADELRGDVELDETEMARRLEERGISLPGGAVGDTFYVARRQAILERLGALDKGHRVGDQDLPFARVRAALLPRTPEEVRTGVVSVLEDEWDKYLTRREFARFSFPPPAGISTYAPVRMQHAPLRRFSNAAAGGAFVDYEKFGTAVVRSLPLLLNEHDRFYPQMGLALACRMLDADVDHMRVVEGGDVLKIPLKHPDQRGRRELSIPLAPPRTTTEGFVFGNLIDIPWFGRRDWETMYDFPRHQVRKQHLPMNDVWQACDAQRRLVANLAKADEALRGLFSVLDLKKLREFEQQKLAADDFDARRKTIELALVDAQPNLDAYAGFKPEEIDEDGRIFIGCAKLLRQLLQYVPPLVKERDELRRGLREKMADKAVLVGWASTAAVADFVPTSLHEKCPGVVVHGVIFNGIMTGELWRREPWKVAALVSIAVGLVTALAVGWLSPVRGMIVAAALAAGYAAVNGIVLFDYGNRIVGLAGPLTTVGVVWAGCTLTTMIAEVGHRERIKRRFSNYADSRLVNYFLKNEDATFQGETREMSVVFTDLAGFTALSERVGEKIVPVLNELWGELVPIIREQHQGYINKFLGDGVMFFYGGLEPHPDHATDAVATLMDLHARLAQFNQRLAERGLPPLAMRAGMVSGAMVVGDAGGGERSDYTVLGDNVNLSSRLEAANKQTGTQTLINARAYELLNGRFLVRPIGKLQVVGQEQATLVYEPMARSEAATDAQREVAAVTAKMVQAFTNACFEQCVAQASELDALSGGGGPGKLTALYRGLCERYLRDGKPDNFDGRIVLTSK